MIRLCSHLGMIVNIGCLNATGFSDRIMTSKGGIIMLNKNMKALRKAKGLSQEELAIKLNVVRQTVSKWEQGLSVPDAGMLIQIAEALDTTVNILLGEELLGEEILDSEKTDHYKTLADKLEMLKKQYSKQNEHRRQIWRIVFTVVFVVSVIELIRYLFFFGSIHLIKNIGNASVSASTTVIAGGDAPAYISFWYYLSAMKPVFMSVLAAIISIVGLCRTEKNNTR
jgi:putative transcriptional regulator